MRFLWLSAFLILVCNIALAQDENFGVCNSVLSCSESIANTIQMNWSRPPLATKTTSPVMLLIRLEKSGSIISVTIEKSSGNEKLDQSALMAVKKSKCFCQIQGLSNEDFEENFKETKITFSPLRFN